MPDDSPGAARQIYDRAERLWKQGRAAEALPLLEQAIALDPGCPNAHNLAGWLLVGPLAGLPDAGRRAIAHFEEARRRFPDDPVPLANLADALLAAGDADGAVALMTEAVTGDLPIPARAHNWLGWYYLTHGDLDAALDHLGKALRYGWWGPALQNHGRALEAHGDLDAARQAYLNALRVGDAHDPPLVLSRLGALARDRGQLRRALSWFRRALHLEQVRGGGRAGEIAAACAALEGQLRAAGGYFPAAGDEEVWIEDDLRRRCLADGVDARAQVAARDQLAGMAGAARPGTSDGEAEAIDRVVAAVRGGTLDPARAGAAWLPEAPAAASALTGPPGAADPADQRPGAPQLARLRQAWSRWHRLLYTRLCEREEPPPGAEPATTVRALVAAGDHAAALARLGELRRSDLDGLLACAGLAEAAGDDAALDGDGERAAAYYAEAEAANRWFASMATAGAEGLSRMSDVHRLEAKIRRSRAD